jgi:hypothetical protein
MPRCETGKHKNRKTNKCEPFISKKSKNKTYKKGNNAKIMTKPDPIQLFEEYNQFYEANRRGENPIWKQDYKHREYTFAGFIQKKYKFLMKKHEYSLTSYQNYVRFTPFLI